MEDRQEKEIRFLVYFLILAFVGAFSYFFLYKTILNNVKKIQFEYLFYNNLLKEKEENLNKFNEAAAIYKKNKSTFEKINQALLEDINDKIFLLVQFDLLASKNKMTTESFSFGELTTGSGDFGLLPINLSVKGKYSSFKNYLDSITYNLPLMEVETIQFSPTEDSSLYTFSLQVNVYSKEVPQSQQTKGNENQEGQPNTNSSSTTPSSSPTPTPETSPATSPATTAP